MTLLHLRRNCFQGFFSLVHEKYVVWSSQSTPSGDISDTATASFFRMISRWDFFRVVILFCLQSCMGEMGDL